MKRRVALVLGIAGLMVLGVAAVAFAASFIGNNQANTITGTANNDNIHGIGGGDTLNGAGGNDYITGDLGTDTIDGAGGNDQLYGGPGQDRLFGGDGNDLLDGGLGPDTMFGEAGDDIIIGVDGISGNDTLNGGSDTATGTDVCVYDASFGTTPADDASGCERNYAIDTHDSGPTRGGS